MKDWLDVYYRSIFRRFLADTGGIIVELPRPWVPALDPVAARLRSSGRIIVHPHGFPNIDHSVIGAVVRGVGIFFESSGLCASLCLLSRGATSVGHVVVASRSITFASAAPIVRALAPKAIFSIYIALMAICDPIFFLQLPSFRVGLDKERASRGVISL